MTINTVSITTVSLSDSLRGAPMGMSELECRVAEFSALVKSQLRLIRQLEKRGKDLTSAKIVFDSLRLSFFLAVQD